MAKEPDALWEEALQEQEDELDRLANDIVALAITWYGTSANGLRHAERFLRKTRYLKGNTHEHSTR